MKTVPRKLISLYDPLVGKLDFPQSFFLLFLRLTCGWGFFHAGWDKLTHLEGAAGFFMILGIPVPAFSAGLVGLFECVGGALLFLGVFSRVVSIPLCVIMFVAYIMSGVEALRALCTWDWTNLYVGDPFFYMFVTLTVFLFGPGKFSFDAVWVARCPHRAAAAEKEDVAPPPSAS